ncbi:MAG: NAD-dependent epimerase/dehydratase family protein [Gaiellales bacterium]
MRVLVTGGAGFIGSHLADRLLAAGHEVRAFDALDPQVHPDGPPAYLDGGVELIIGDVRDADALDRALVDVDAVVHLAAAVGVGQSMYEIRRYVDVNSVGCAVLLERLLEQRDRIRRLVVASSMSIYGEGQYRDPATGESGLAPGLRPEAQLAERRWELERDGSVLEPERTREDKPLLPTSVYAVTKRDHEELCLAVGEAYDVPTAALRLFNVYGPRQALGNPYTGVAAIFGGRLINGHAPVAFEDGRQTRDFVHVTDVARAFHLAVESDAAGLVTNVCTGHPASVVDIARGLAAGLGTDIEPEVVGRYRAGDIRHCIGDPARARDALGFAAEVELSEGLADLAGWMAEQKAEDRVDQAMAELRRRGLER